MKPEQRVKNFHKNHSLFQTVNYFAVVVVKSYALREVLKNPLIFAIK